MSLLLNKLILGTANFSSDYGINNKNGKLKPDEIKDILAQAKQHGVTELDTAEAYPYGSTDFEISTKFKPSRDFILQLRQNLESLGVNRFKTYYFHDIEDLYRFREWDQVQEALGTGMIDSLGCSIYTNNDLDAVLNYSLVNTIQLPFNLWNCDDEKLSLLYKAKRNKKLIARSVFLQGLFFKRPEVLPEKFYPIMDELMKLQDSALYHRYGILGMALEFVMKFGLFDGIIVGVDDAYQFSRIINAWLFGQSSLACEYKVNIESHLIDPRNW